MDEGKYFMAIAVTDEVGLTSRIVQTPIRIKKKVAVPVFATIHGSIRFASAAQRAFTSIHLLTKDEKEVPGGVVKEFKADTYEIPKRVPAGEYIVRADVTLSNGRKQKNTPVEVTKPGRLKVDFDLSK